MLLLYIWPLLQNKGQKDIFLMLFWSAFENKGYWAHPNSCLLFWTKRYRQNDVIVKHIKSLTRHVIAWRTHQNVNGTSYSQSPLPPVLRMLLDCVGRDEHHDNCIEHRENLGPVDLLVGLHILQGDDWDLGWVMSV